MKIRRGVDPAVYANPPGLTPPPVSEHHGDRRPPRTEPVKASAYTPRPARAAADPSTYRDPTDAEQQAGVDFEQHQQQHDDAAQELHDEWPDIIAAVVAALAVAAGAAVAAGMLAE